MTLRFLPALARAAARLQWLLPALPLLMTACQATRPNTAAAQADVVVPPVKLSAVPDCPDGQTATLSDGLVVHYSGADRQDSSTCLVQWNGRTHRYLLGVVAKAPRQIVSPGEREAIRTALLGPVGTISEFEDAQATLWGRVTVEHLGDPVLRLKTGPRRTVLLRIVRHDAHGRPNVRAISLHWVDARTGIVLKQQVMTEMDNGQKVTSDVWSVESLG